jgi:hypothetical protein
VSEFQFPGKARMVPGQEGKTVVESKRLVEGLQVNVPYYLSEAFNKNAVVEMELALAKACATLPPNLDKHQVRTFIASRITKRVQQGNTFSMAL